MRTILCAVSVILSVASHAQIPKNTMMVGGRANLIINTKSDYFGYDFFPSLGWFYSKNTVLGVAPGVSHRYDTGNSSVRLRNHSQGLSVWSRYYINPNHRISFFPEASVGFNYGSFAGGNSSNLNLSLSLGAAFWLTDNITIEPTIRMLHFIKDKSESVHGYLILKDTDAMMRVALQIYLNRSEGEP